MDSIQQAVVATRVLFLSFSGTLGQLVEGKITDADLASGLFYFGCTPGHAFFPDREEGAGNELTWFDPVRAKAAHKKLVDALVFAEKQARVAWRPAWGHNALEQLNELLAQNGIAPIADLEKRFASSWSYPGIEGVIRKQGIPLRVVWTTRKW